MESFVNIIHRLAAIDIGCPINMIIVCISYILCKILSAITTITGRATDE